MASVRVPVVVLGALFCVALLGALAVSYSIHSKPVGPELPREAWEDAVHQMEETARLSHSQALRERAELVGRLARYGYRLGYQDGDRTCD